jgi:hypothetical protein
MADIVRFILDIEEGEDDEGKVTDLEAQHLLNELEDLLAKQGYYIHDQSWERDRG